MKSSAYVVEQADVAPVAKVSLAHVQYHSVSESSIRVVVQDSAALHRRTRRYPYVAI